MSQLLRPRVELYYGQSGTGKSEANVAVIKKIAAETGKKARVLVGDGSAATYDDHGLIDAGVVDLLEYTTRDYPLTTMQLLLEGYWPADVTDPTSPLVKPDPNGTNDQKKAFKDLMDTGIYVIEGLSVMSDYIMGDNIGGLSYRAARGEKIGQDAPIRVGDGHYEIDPQTRKPVFVPAFEGAQEFGDNAPAHFKFAQRRIKTFVERTKVLPVKMVIWTAHERVAEKKYTVTRSTPQDNGKERQQQLVVGREEVVIGPSAAGEALTVDLKRMFNNTLHFQIASRKVRSDKKDEHTGRIVDEIDQEYRIYTRDHFHPDGGLTLKFLAVTRAVPAGTGKLLEDGSYDGMPEYLTGKPGEAIEEFYRRVAAHKRLQTERTKTMFEAARAKEVA